MKKYICCGENFNRNAKIGFCGDIHTLPKWIDILFGEKATGYFDNWPDKEIIKYIKENAGKRLEILK